MARPFWWGLGPLGAVPRSLSTSGLQLQMTSAPTTTVAVVKCPASRSIPPGAPIYITKIGQEMPIGLRSFGWPGVPIQSADDCQCSPGYGFNPVTGAGDACGQGEYKAGACAPV